RVAGAACTVRAARDRHGRDRPGRVRAGLPTRCDLPSPVAVGDRREDRHGRAARRLRGRRGTVPHQPRPFSRVRRVHPGPGVAPSDLPTVPSGGGDQGPPGGCRMSPTEIVAIITTIGVLGAAGITFLATRGKTKTDAKTALDARIDARVKEQLEGA